MVSDRQGKGMVTNIGIDHIRKLRTQRGLSQETLGEKAGLHHTYIGAVERGEQNCTMSVLEKIAHGLDKGSMSCSSLPPSLI